MARLIFTVGMSLFIGSIFLGLTGCAYYGDYDDYADNHHKYWKERAFSRHSGSGK